MPLIAWLVLHVAAAGATSLVGQYQFSNADVAPKKLWTFGYSRSQANIQGAFDSSGSKVSNTDYFSKTLTYAHLLDDIRSPTERTLAQAAFTAYGKSLNESAGTVVNDISIEQKSDTFFIGRGLTDKSMVLLIFPIVTIDTRLSSRFVPSESMVQFTEQLKKEGQISRANEILEKSQNALYQSLASNGYHTRYPSRVTSLANVFLDYRHQVWKSARLKAALDSFLVIPAGEKFSTEDFMPIRINEEQWSVKQAASFEWDCCSGLSAGSSLYYHKRFGFERAQRIPANSASPISNDVDQNTSIQYGDEYGLVSQLKWTATDWIGVYGGQGYQYKFQDQYSGGAFESSRYDLLEQDTEQNLGTAFLGFEIKTINAFLAGDFMIPMILNVQYAYANLGSNVLNSQTVSLNMSVFYQ